MATGEQESADDTGDESRSNQNPGAVGVRKFFNRQRKPRERNQRKDRGDKIPVLSGIGHIRRRQQGCRDQGDDHDGHVDKKY